MKGVAWKTLVAYSAAEARSLLAAAEQECPSALPALRAAIGERPGWHGTDAWNGRGASGRADHVGRQ